MQRHQFAVLLFICTSFFVSFSTLAKEGGFYGIGSVGYAANDIDGKSLDEVSYKLGIGYELARQWNIEIGFQALGEDKIRPNELNFDNASQEITSVYLTALGKAANRHGELFYRIGLLRTDIRSDYISAGVECEFGGTIMLASEGTSVCQFSESNIAGVLGIGFDFYIHHSSMLRLELEHIQGQNGYSAQAIYVGYRLNF